MVLFFEILLVVAAVVITWFAIYGANINLDAEGNVTSIIDAKAALDLYRDYCGAMGLDCSKLIVHGE